jgi:hypothetical protein
MHQVQALGCSSGGGGADMGAFFAKSLSPCKRTQQAWPNSHANGVKKSAAGPDTVLT